MLSQSVPLMMPGLNLEQLWSFSPFFRILDRVCWEIPLPVQWNLISLLVYSCFLLLIMVDFRISSHNLLPGGIQFDKVLPVLSVIYLAVCLSVDLCIDPKIKTYTGCLILWNFLQLSSICCKYCTNFDCARKAGKCREAIKRHRILLGNDSLLSKNASCSYIFGFRKLASIFLKSFTFWTFVSCSMK